MIPHRELPAFAVGLSRASDGTYFGKHDLLRPMLAASAARTLDEWRQRVPAGFDLCRAVPHSVREAAWDGDLVISGPEGWMGAFSTLLAGRSPSDRLADLDEIEAAHASLQAARWLSSTFRRAEVGEPDAYPAVHPLVDDTEIDNAPFGFARVSGGWRGVSPRSLLEFSVDWGEADAEAFLSTVVRDPARWFKDIERLQRALIALSADGDVAAYKSAVMGWNDEQSVSMPVVDTSIVVPSARWSGREDAKRWCEDFEASSQELVAHLLESKWPWPGDSGRAPGSLDCC